MSNVVISPNASGTGTFTIAAPNSNTNRTIDLPDAAGAVVLDSATQTLTNKTINASQLVDASIIAAKLSGAQSGSAPIYAARAWVNFNGTGTVAVRASGNVSSISDLGVGQYQVNFTTAMPDANYCAQYTGQYQTGLNWIDYLAIGNLTTTSVQVGAFEGGTYYDMFACHVSIFR